MTAADNEALARELRRLADSDDEQLFFSSEERRILRRAADALEAKRMPTREEIRAAMLGHTTTTARIEAIFALVEPKEAREDG